MNQPQEHSSQDVESHSAASKFQGQQDPQPLDKIMERLERMEKKLDSLLSKSLPVRQAGESPRPFERNRRFSRGGRRDFKFQDRQDRPHFRGSQDSRREQPSFQDRDRQPHFGSQDSRPRKPWYSKRKHFSHKNHSAH